MNLSRKDWLFRLIVSPGSESELAAVQGSPRARARLAREHVSQRLAHLGLLYGTPLLPAQVAADQKPEERFFLGLMAGLVRLGRELAVLLGRPAARRNADLAVPFLALAGRLKDAEALMLSSKPPSDAEVKRALSRAEPHWAARREALTADPVFGVPLHNGVFFVDAWTFGRLAISCFVEGELRRAPTERRLLDAEHDKAALAEALVQLVWAEHPPSSSERRAMSRQIGALGLPRAATRQLRRSLDRPTAPADLADRVRGREHRRFVLAQAVLASQVDGRRSPLELAFLRRLADAFHFDRQEVAALEFELANFYAENREFVDTFTAGEAGVELADELVNELAHQVERNLSAVMQEIRQTGELAELLAKAARGHTLSPEERKQVRRDLIDVAKAVPSLAIVAAPGGLLLLAALAKVLPFSILPSAFNENPAPRPPTRRAGGG